MSTPGAAAGSIDPRARTAAANNAAWCAAMCRAHGLPTRQDDSRWWSSSRTPPCYPDAVTLDPTTDAAELLVGVDCAAGCSVKDSFRSLDLTSAGFQPLFDADWIHAPAAVVASTAVTATDVQAVVVRDPAALRQWQRAWGSGASEIFVPALLEDPAVALISVFDGETVVGVAALNHASGAVGISNLVAPDGSSAPIWRAVMTAAAALFPGADLVGYEHGNDLRAAVASGFRPVGPLRIWAR